MTKKLPSAIVLRQFAVYIVGGILTGLGIAGLLRAQLGTDPFDAINAALGAKLHLSVGVCAWINASVVLLLAWRLGRRPKLGTVAIAVLIGICINIGLALIVVPHGLVLRGVLATAALVVLYLGVTGYVISDLGAGALEELMLALVARGAKIHRARWGIEAVLIVLALFLQGPINVVTIVFVALTGPVLAWTIPRFAAMASVPLPQHDPQIPLGDIR